METILDFSTDLNIQLFDKVVTTFYTGMGAEQQMASQTLTQFQEHPDSWQRVDAILEQSSLPYAKYIALQILEKLIQTRWKILPAEQRNGIKNYIVSVVIKNSSDDAALTREKQYLNKLNLVLVQILKQEWPHNWPTFIPEIVASSRTSLSLCENNMVILKLLSEEIFDYSAEQMTQVKTRNLKNQMCGEFSEIFNLCYEVLEKATKPSLIKATLETLLKFLNWIPLGYIFQTTLIEMLCSRFLETPQFRNITLQCLTEIAALNDVSEYQEKFVTLFSQTIKALPNLIPPGTNIPEGYENGSDQDQELVQNLALFLTSFFTCHIRLVEATELREFLLTGHQYLIEISRVKEREVFKVCLEYWAKLVADLYEETQHLPAMEMPLFAGNGVQGLNLRKNIYTEVLHRCRYVMIENMVRPEEVLIVENEEGVVVREFVKESDTIALYKSIREVLVYLTHLDHEDTENIMSEKLARQVDGSEWSWQNLNQLCWAIGSISGALSEDVEKRFLVTVIKELLGLCEMKRGKDNKAVVASNIMYIVGQYPRFLKAHWKFLKTVVNKLFEFMHETHEGVQDMACDTFIKISQKCRRHFVVQQTGEVMPFIEEILADIHQITNMLHEQQIHTFYEAVGYMIAAQPMKPAQERLVLKLMEGPNHQWDAIMAQAAQSYDVLNDYENLKALSNILKTNTAAATSIGPGFYKQLSRIYMDMLSMYKAVSEIISTAIAQDPKIAPYTPRVKALRSIKKEVLKLVECFITKAEESQLSTINDSMIPPLLDAVLGDYQRNVEQARDAEVLHCMATIVEKLGMSLDDKISPILDAVFGCTLNMINKEFIEFPEHRSGFFKLVRNINQHCFPSLLRLDANQFKLFVDSVVWGIKHTMRDIAEISLGILIELFNNFTRADPSVSNAFYQGYFLSLLQDVFFVLTDSDHKSGFKQQCMVLSNMCQLVETGQVQSPLFNPQQVNDATLTNQQYLREYIRNLLKNAFPHLTDQQIHVFVLGLFEFTTDFAKFKPHVRDFLIQLKEFSGDSQDLFLDEREAEIEAKKKSDFEAALKIPGMVKPSERPDEMAD